MTRRKALAFFLGCLTFGLGYSWSARRHAEQEIDEQLEQLHRLRQEAGAIGRNAVRCLRCGRVQHFPNGDTFRDCLFNVRSCAECDRETLT